MKRLKGSDIVHFAGNGDMALCGVSCISEDLFGTCAALHDTSDAVNCPDCARLYCQIKNAPWPEVETAALQKGMLDAVIPPYDESDETDESEGITVSQTSP